MSRHRRGHCYRRSTEDDEPAPLESRRPWKPMIKYYCDKCGKEQQTPSQDGNACLYYGYNFPDENLIVHIAYRQMNVASAINFSHWCPRCLIEQVERRIGPINPPPGRIINDR